MSEIILLEIVEGILGKKQNYNEEEKKIRHKEALKRNYEKNKEKRCTYYREKYQNLPEEEKQQYITINKINNKTKYDKLTDEEKKEYINKINENNKTKHRDKSNETKRRHYYKKKAEKTIAINE